MSRRASASQSPRPRIACCRHGPGSPAASARIQPVLRRSSPKQTLQEQTCIRRNTLLREQRTYPFLDFPKRRRPQRKRLFNRRCLRPRSPNHGCPWIQILPEKTTVMLGIAPSDGGLHHALGLGLIRLKRHDAALVELRLAADLAGNCAQYAYVCGVALHSAGCPHDARAHLKESQDAHPGDREILVAITSFSREVGESVTAFQYAETL